jgi:hypothetical protein
VLRCQNLRFRSLCLTKEIPALHEAMEEVASADVRAAEREASSRWPQAAAGPPPARARHGMHVMQPSGLQQAACCGAAQQDFKASPTTVDQP